MNDKIIHIEPNVLEIKLDKTIQNFLERRSYEYFDVETMDIEENSDVKFIKIYHMSYDRSKDESDLHLIDFQQILSAISSYSGKIVYRIESTKDGVSLYLGTTNSQFLKDTVEGIYSGTQISEEQPNPDTTYSCAKAMLGIPALKRDSDKSFKQSLEKILFPMQGKEFRITLIAESYQLETIQEIISNYQSLGDELHKFVKQTKSIQESEAKTDGTSIANAETEGTSESEAKTEGSSRKALKGVLLPMLGLGGAGALVGGINDVGSKLGATLHEISPNIGESFDKIESVGTGKYGDIVEDIGAWWSTVWGDHDQIGEMAEAGADTVLGELLGSALGLGAGAMGGMIFGKTLTSSTTETKTKTNSSTKTNTTNNSNTSTQLKGITFDEISKSAEYCEKLIDKHIERFQKGLNHGMWNSTLYIEAKEETTLDQLEHTLKSVYAGDESFYEPIRFSNDLIGNYNLSINKLPMLYADEKRLSHPIHPSFSGFSTAVNTEELSILTALPSNDVDGISVSKVSVFGLTQSKKEDDYIEIGNILNKKKKTAQRFFLSKEAINSHIFVSGITGSGKSNTIKLILEKIYNDEKIPFLVIEPAKSEYKHLLNDIKDLQIFRPGAKDDIFKFNPFIFEYTKDENTTTLIQHVDMLKTTFSSAFPMYGPMPYILEEAIHKVYEDKGWNFNTQHHKAYAFSKSADFERKSMLFPTMNDLKNKIDSVVENAGYADELNSNIKAALRTRINNLTIGTKGNIFNSRHSFSDEILFNKPTIIELSNIVDDEEKAFLMGLLLNKLYKYRVLQSKNDNELKHVTVIEEAHRLLPNISSSNNQESSDTKAKAVETFTNILAEIRSLGEGIIVADQIASKLHQDVIKNTNVKILHRTMAKEDRDIIGESINLTEDQILDIAELKTGEAIVHNKDVHQAFMVQVDQKHEQQIDYNNEQIKDFYKRFLDSNANMSYKYEFIGESKFFDKNYIDKLMDIYELKKLKLALIRFLNVVFVSDAKRIIDEWKYLFNEFTNEQKKVINYHFAILWQELDFIGNYEYYYSVDGYLNSTKAFNSLIQSLASKNKVEEKMKSFIDSYKHENIKVIYPAMKDYDDERIDYTLILEENFFNNKEYVDFNRATFKSSSKNCKDKVDAVLKQIFTKQNPDLKESFVCMKFSSSKYKGVSVNELKRICL